MEGGRGFSLPSSPGVVGGLFASECDARAASWRRAAAPRPLDRRDKAAAAAARKRPQAGPCGERRGHTRRRGAAARARDSVATGGDRGRRRAGDSVSGCKTRGRQRNQHQPASSLYQILKPIGSIAAPVHIATVHKAMKTEARERVRCHVVPFFDDSQPQAEADLNERHHVKAASA